MSFEEDTYPQVFSLTIISLPLAKELPFTDECVRGVDGHQSISKAMNFAMRRIFIKLEAHIINH